MSRTNQQLSTVLAGLAFAAATGAFASAAPGLGGTVGGAVGGAHGAINAGVNAAGINAGANANANGSVNGPQRQPHVALPQVPNALNLANGAVHATVTAIAGNTITLKLADGTTQTITDAKAAAAFKVGQAVTIAKRDGDIVMAGEGGEHRTYRGVVTAVSGNTLTLKLANGTTQTITVANQTLNVKAGETVRIKQEDGKLIAFADDDVDHVKSIATRVYRGTVTAVNGLAVTVKLANGTSQTLTVNKHAAAQLKTGETVTVKQRGSHFSLLSEDR